MENDIRSLTKEMKNYYLQITKADNDDSLTTIQRKECQISIQEELQAKGISYSISTHWDIPINDRRICFSSPPWYVNETGIINDVHPEGPFPFSLSISDNISVHYDPRNLTEEDRYNWSSLKNKEFLNFQKGSEYKFSGKISYCDYYFNAKPERFHFAIIGGGAQSGNCFIATACYGNYDIPEVLVLRQFRDEILLTTFLGKVL